jgi:beta-glucosidase
MWLKYCGDTAVVLASPHGYPAESADLFTFRVVGMSNPALHGSFQSVDWGVATADSIAAPLPDHRETAADWSDGHHQQWSEDVRAVAGASPATYRTVLGWRYVQPDGAGQWDRTALDRCDRALDAALARGLRPGLTLLHRDLPDWLAGSGGWLSRDTALRFAEYAAEMGQRFGDRVDRWITSSDLVAPAVAECVAGMGPTGQGLGAAGLPAVHHLLLANGLAGLALRGAGVTAEIGTTVTLYGGYPATDDPFDRIALERLESWGNRLFLDPMLLGEHMTTEDGRSPVGESGCVRPGDMEIVSAAQDSIALSWHLPLRVTAPENLPGVLPVLGCFQALNDVNRLLMRLGFAVVPFEQVETNSYGWPVVPESLADALASLHDLYGDLLPPLRIVDNGMSDPDGDTRRSRLAARLSWLARVMACGVDIRGYEYWSVLDNFEHKLRYSRLYGVAVPAGEPVPQPPIPRDWSHADAFGDRGGHCGEDRGAGAPRSLQLVSPRP